MKVPAAAVAAVEVLVPAAGEVEREGPLIPAEPGVRGLFTEAEEEEMSDFLGGSVSVLTGDSYERSWKLWLEHLRTGTNRHTANYKQSPKNHVVQTDAFPSSTATAK